MNAVLLSRPALADPPEPYDGMPVSEADYWECYYLGHAVTYEWNDDILEEKGVSDYLTFQVFNWFIQLRAEEERQWAEQGWQRAQQVELRIQQEQTQVERLTAQLRALGIDPDAQS